MRRGQGVYYLDLAQDYYLEGGEPPGEWWGSAAEALGFKGTVQRAELESLLAGFSPGGEPITQYAGTALHRPGFDLTFSAPKPVSTYWSQVDEAVRRQVQQAHREAVHEALRYLEEEVSFCRRGKGGTQQVKAGLAVAIFEHGTSRSADPQLHSHALLLNIGKGSDGKFGCIDARTLYHHKMVAGALYRAELASQLQKRLGLIVRRSGHSFEIEGVPEKLVREFSKRRQSIEAALQAKGLSGASASAAAALATRTAKGHAVPREELFRRWQEVGRSFKYAPPIPSPFRRPERLDANAAEVFVTNGLREVSKRVTRFGKRDLLRGALEAAQGSGVSASDVRLAVDKRIRSGGEICKLPASGGEALYGTTASLSAEGKMIARASTLLRGPKHGAPSHHVEAAIKRHASPRSSLVEEVRHHARQLLHAARKQRTKAVDRNRIKNTAPRILTPKQSEAIREVTRRGRGQLRFFEMTADAKGAFALGVARQIWERAGYRVLAAARSRKKADELQEISGVKTITHRGLERLMKPTLGDYAKHHLRQLGRALVGKPTFRSPALVIREKLIVVVSEAERLSSPQLLKAMRAAKRGGGLLVLASSRSSNAEYSNEPYWLVHRTCLEAASRNPVPKEAPHPLTSSEQPVPNVERERPITRTTSHLPPPELQPQRERRLSR